MSKAFIYSILLLVVPYYGCTENKIPDHEAEPQYSIEKTNVFSEFTRHNEGSNQQSEEPFGRVISIAVSDSTENLYILDSDYKEVFVFDSLDNYQNSIKGGYGRGPGEFEFPRDISVDRSEKIYVYDYNLRRITIFDSFGEVLTTIPANIASKSILVSGDNIWFSSLGSRKNKVARKNLIEDSFTHHISVTERDLEFTPGGSVASLGFNKHDELLVASLIPGIWYKKVDNIFKDFGMELLAGRKAYINKENISISPGGTLGIGGLFEDKIGIVWREQHVVNDVPELGLFRLEIFEETGEHIETVELPMKWANDVYFDQKNNIYFAVDDPIPGVEKYTVTESKN